MKGMGGGMMGGMGGGMMGGMGAMDQVMIQYDDNLEL